MKILKRILIALVLLFLVIQVVRPDRFLDQANPAADPSRTVHAVLAVPPEVGSILQRSCSDCHSHQTRWPWYSQVAPVSWLLADHVKHARSHVNLSDWAQYDAEKASDKLEEMCEEVSEGAMPLPSYLWLHRDAALSPQDVRTLCEWTESTRQRLAQQARRGGQARKD